LKKLYVFGMAVALMAPLGVLTAGAAGAAAGTVCSGQSGAATIAPGLNNTPRTVTITATTSLSKCTGTVKTGKGKAVIKMTKASCLGLAKTGQLSKITETITWNTKKTSTFSGTSKTGPKVGQATITGTITKGVFAKSKVSTVIAFVVKKGQSCSGAGIKNLTITSVKAFTIK
jgi:hypothetical protein